MKNKAKVQDVYDRITAQMIEQLEKGKVPWLSPWNSSKARKDVPLPAEDIWPRNAITRHLYSGANVFMCWLHQIEIGKEGEPRLFLTYQQAKERGGHVRKGERGCTLIAWVDGHKVVTDDAGEDKVKRWRAPRAHYVFHISQCEGITLPVHREQEKPTGLDNDERWQVFLKATDADIHHGGDRAFYNVMMDHIGMPAARHFVSPNAYKAVMLHELGHWTGHSKRLARKFGLRKDDHDYAFEELVAELSSAFMCARLGVVQTELRHAEYLRMYLGVLKFDNKAIVQAASKASAAANFVVDLATPALKEHSDAQGAKRPARKAGVRKQRAPKKAAAKAKANKNGAKGKARKPVDNRKPVARNTAVSRVGGAR